MGWALIPLRVSPLEENEKFFRVLLIVTEQLVARSSIVNIIGSITKPVK